MILRDKNITELGFIANNKHVSMGYKETFPVLIIWLFDIWNQHNQLLSTHGAKALNWSNHDDPCPHHRNLYNTSQCITMVLEFALNANNYMDNSMGRLDT